MTDLDALLDTRRPPDASAWNALLGGLANDYARLLAVSAPLAAFEPPEAWTEALAAGLDDASLAQLVSLTNGELRDRLHHAAAERVAKATGLPPVGRVLAEAEAGRPIDFAVWNRLFRASDDEKLRQVAACLPLDRFAPPERVAHELAAGLSDDALRLVMPATQGPTGRILLSAGLERPALRDLAAMLMASSGVEPETPAQRLILAGYLLDGRQTPGGLRTFFDAEQAAAWAERLDAADKTRLLATVNDPVGRELLGAPGRALTDLVLAELRAQDAERPDHDRGAREPLEFAVDQLARATGPLRRAFDHVLAGLDRDGDPDRLAQRIRSYLPPGS